MSQVTSISVEYRETVSLPEYRNVTIGHVLTARLEDGENHDAARSRLYGDVRDYVHNLIDNALEENGVPALHYSGPRYSIVKTSLGESAAIVLDDVTAKVNLVYHQNFPLGRVFAPSEWRNRRLKDIEDTIARRGIDAEVLPSTIETVQDLIEWYWSVVSAARFLFRFQDGDLVSEVVVVPGDLARALYSNDAPFTPIFKGEVFGGNDLGRRILACSCDGDGPLAVCYNGLDWRRPDEWEDEADDEIFDPF